MDKFICGYCCRRYKRKDNCKRHCKNVHRDLDPICLTNLSKCPHCQKRLGDNAEDHLISCKFNKLNGNRKRQKCFICDKTFPSRSALMCHRRRKHDVRMEEEEGEVDEIENIGEAQNRILNGSLDYRLLIDSDSSEKMYSPRFQTTIIKTTFSFSNLSKALAARGLVLDVVKTVLTSILSKYRYQESLALQVVLDSPKYLGNKRYYNFYFLRVYYYFFQITRLQPQYSWLKSFQQTQF